MFPMKYVCLGIFCVARLRKNRPNYSRVRRRGCHWLDASFAQVVSGTRIYEVKMELRCARARWPPISEPLRRRLQEGLLDTTVSETTRGKSNFTPRPTGNR